MNDMNNEQVLNVTKGDFLGFCNKR
ncbi:DUF3948 family protein [Bacillus mycoides]